MTGFFGNTRFHEISFWVCVMMLEQLAFLMPAWDMLAAIVVFLCLQMDS